MWWSRPQALVQRDYLAATTLAAQHAARGSGDAGEVRDSSNRSQQRAQSSFELFGFLGGSVPLPYLFTSLLSVIGLRSVNRGAL